MLIRSVLFVVLLAGASSLVDAQRVKRRPVSPAPVAAPQPVGPEYVDVIEAVVDGQRVDLERVEPNYRARVKGLGFGGMTVGLEVAGSRSPVRFASGKSIEFVIRVATQDTDPVSYVSMYRAKATKKARVMQISQGGMMGGTATGNGGGDQKVATTGSKYGSRFYRIKPIGSLVPGEYMIKGGTGTTAYMFGVD